MQHSNIVKVVLASTLFAVIARFVQVFKLTESATGFSKNDKGSLWGQTIMFIVIIISVIVPFIATTLFSKRQPVRSPKLNKSPKFAIIGYICAGTFALQAVLLLIDGAFTTGVLVAALLYLLSAFAIAVYTTTAFKKVKFPTIIMAAPVALFVYLLIEKFISFNGMSTLIENVFTVVYLSLQTLFFLTHAKLVSSVEIRKSSRRILTLSALTLLFSAVCSIPNLAVLLIGKGELVHDGSFNIAFIVYGIYSFIYSSVVYAKRQMPSSGVPSVKKLNVGEQPEVTTKFLVPDNEIH